MATAATGTGTPRPAAKKTTATHPGTTTSGAKGAGPEPTQKSLQQHLVTVSDGDLSSADGLYEFVESLRALLTGIGFFVAAGASQLDQAARKGARESKDGRLTMTDKARLKVVLRRVSRKLGNDCTGAILDGATDAVKAYALMEEFLDNLESTQVSRPHRNTRGGFNPFQGN